MFFHYIIKNYTKYMVNVRTSFVGFIATKTNILDMDVLQARLFTMMIYPSYM